MVNAFWMSYNPKCTTTTRCTQMMSRNTNNHLYYYHHPRHHHQQQQQQQQRYSWTLFLSEEEEEEVEPQDDDDDTSNTNHTTNATTTATTSNHSHSNHNNSSGKIRTNHATDIHANMKWKSWFTLNTKWSKPPITTILKQRRLQEIQLLQELEYSNDDAIESLWKLWSMERGHKNAAILLQAEQHMARGELEEARQQLQSLIQLHGMHWAEPMNKLATLYYMTGQYAESKELCLLVLQVKPWHFGALSGIVLVCIAMNDVIGARFWADRRLPPIVPIHTSGNRRSQWVQRAVQDAKESLDRDVDSTWNAFESKEEEEEDDDETGENDKNDENDLDRYSSRRWIERQEMEFRQSRNQMKNPDDENHHGSTIYWNEMDEYERNSSWQ
jgi:tetratricopeptide (TPR) repeat protein